MTPYTEPGRRLAVAAAACVAGFTAPASAGVWNLEPGLSVSSEYSTNPQLRLGEQVAGYAAVANTSLSTSWDDGARHFEIAPRARFAAAGGDSALGRDGYFLSSRGEFNTERSLGALTGNWTDDSAAIADPSPGTLTRIDVRRLQEDLGLEWRRDWTARVGTDASAAWQSVRYGYAPGAGLYDYRNLGLNAQLTDALTERVQLQVVAAASRFNSPDLAGAEDSYSLQAGVAGHLSARTSYTLLYGLSRVQAVGLGSQPSGAVYVASVSRQGLRSKWSASISESVQPSGFLTLVRAREVTARDEFMYTERASCYVQLRYAQTSDVFQSTAVADRSYQQVGLGGLWHATTVWDLRADLAWQRQNITAVYPSSIASGRGFGISLVLARRFGRVRLS